MAAFMEDRYGHRISYLRVSITDRCNERCTYCMPHELQEWLAREDVLTYEETLRLVRIATALGVSKIRLTGGDPPTPRHPRASVRRSRAATGCGSFSGCLPSRVSMTSVSRRTERCLRAKPPVAGPWPRRCATLT